MNAVIIEDEHLIAEQLERLIKEIDPSINIIATLGSLKATRKWLSSNPSPDLFFMDIQLSDGVSFQLFDEFKIDSPIIFTTAYNEYAIRAFKVNSIDYIVKPADKPELEQALNKFKKLNKQGINIKEEISGLIQAFSQGSLVKSYKQRFLVQQKAVLIPLESKEIACFFLEGIIYILAFDGKKYVADYKTIEEIEEIVDPEVFFRANRQSIINIQAVESYKADFNGKLQVKLKMSGAPQIDISREKAGNFKKWLTKE